ncbi:cytochrome P450 [Macrolepiota fuliginosa MF-IS2]|uniref:Cytochrome P450 n=1 Tax=Macrolepiota fuliginosa MF-IS2 TaxID=1400762 RepID=A0A9P6BYF1_9AGAR|nr:cytochrome P450 [Macrolepiota fuliginosa MF-IS2]
MISVDLLLSASSFLLALYFYMKKPNAYSSLPLPPGPKGWPVIGNLLDMPTEFEWKTYHEWSKKLGTDILHVSVMGTNIIVLDSPEAVLELMERRSSIYSDRARMPMINELMKWSFNVGFMPYGEYWRKHRRLMHQLLHPTAALRFRPHEIKATHNLLERFLDNPNDPIGNLRYMAGETVLSVAYGIDIKPKEDPYIQTAEQGVHPLVAAAVPGAFLVDMLPWLKYVPEWVPGAGFQKKAKAWGKLAMRMVDMPFEAAKKQIMEGSAKPSFTSFSLERVDEGVKDEAYQEPIIRGSAGTMYAAGSDTTVSAITSCILALLENPEILKKAQAELDSVVTPGHLPDFDDEASLPYITALTMETLRWRDVVPIAIPRYLQVDDEYKGYRLPKGSIVIPNAWAMLHDENVYPDPFTFKPERFLTKDGMIDKSVRDPRHACFGFGRRICPGRYMAFSAVWIALASIVYCFDIKKAVDEHGKEIELKHEYLSALVIFPKPFKCSITPRSPQHVRAIRSAVLEHEFEAN